MVTLESPFPEANYQDLWAWLKEFPLNNFDDFGPKTFEEFQDAMARQTDETWLVKSCGLPVGAISYIAINPHVGTFHACFSKQVHGMGIAAEAVRRVLGDKFDAGVFKVFGEFYADNLQVKGFLEKLGATQEGFLKDQALRDGKPVSKLIYAFFANDFFRTND